MSGIDAFGKNLAAYMPIGATTVYQILVQLLPSTNTTSDGRTAAVCDAKNPDPANRSMLALIIGFLALICFLAPFVVAGKKQKDGSVTYHFVRLFDTRRRSESRPSSQQPPGPTAPLLPRTVPTSASHDSEAGDDDVDRIPLLWRHVIRAVVSLTAFLTFTLLSTDATNCFFGGRTPQATRQVVTAIVALAASAIMGFLPHPESAEAWPFGTADTGLPPELQKDIQEAQRKANEGSGKVMVEELTQILVDKKKGDQKKDPSNGADKAGPSSTPRSQE